MQWNKVYHLYGDLLLKSMFFYVDFSCKTVLSAVILF